MRTAIRKADTALFDADPGRRATAARYLAKEVGTAAASGDDTAGLEPIFAFVNCVDLAGRLGVEEVVTIVQQAADVGGLVAGWTAADEGATCAGVPEDLGKPLTATSSITLPTPPIVINSVADWRTTWLGARRAANVFPGAVMITFDGAQHVTWTRTTSRCVNKPVATYVLTGRLPTRDIACPFVVTD
jgi:hypothetical protein